MKIRINPIFFLFFLLLAFNPQCIARDAFSFEYGTKPSSFCTTQDMKTLPINTFNTVIPSYLQKSTSGDQIQSVHLSQEGVSNMVGSIWYDSYQDWQNGFVVTFNMKVDNVTCMTRTVTQCKIGLLGFCFWEKYSTVDSRCGADGYAFVLQSSGPYTKGQFAGGLGYKMLSNAFAIEFDTWANEDLNDPITAIERHISVIATKGAATANEVDAIAWNDNPLNFKSNKYDGFLVNPLIRIEYLNHRLRVFINNVLQLAYYDVIDIAKLLGINNNKFYMGLTSSTGTYTQDVELSNWSIKIVQPSPYSSTSEPSPSNPTSIRSNEYFLIDLYVKDACLNRYVPTEGDQITDVSWIEDSTSNCKLMSVILGTNNGFTQTGPSYQVSFSCSQVGTKTIQLTYKGKAIKNSVSVKVVANVMTRAKTNIMDLILTNQLANIDTGFDFTIIPWDSGDNLAVTTETEILNKISVVWENPADTRRDHVVTKKLDGSYNFHINTDKAGKYNISSILFKDEIQGSSYNITAIHGAPNPNNSFVRIYDSSDSNNLVEFKDTKVSAGQWATALINLRDRLNNTVTIQNAISDKTSYGLIENGVTKALDSSALNKDFLQMNLRFQMTSKGSNMFAPLFETVPITCLNCIYTVNPLESLFSNADLFIYSNDSNSYVQNKAAVFTVQKGDKFNFLMVLKDKYNNVIDNINAADYEAELSGNFMTVLSLKLTPYTTSGLQVLVADADLNYYQNLVGASNYLITLKEKSTGNIRTFSLTIVSDGSDSDATNDKYVAIRTRISWVIGPIRNKIIVGDTYRASIMLVSAKGLRYNNWIEESLIEATLNVFFPENNETIYDVRKDIKPGMYLIDFVLTKVSNKLRTMSFKIDGANVLTKLRFYDAPNVPYQAFVDNLLDANELIMNPGTILSVYTFTYTLFDKYMNPVDPANSNVDLVLRLNSQPDLVNIKPECNKNGLGVFPCSFTPNIAGAYAVKSDWFTKGSYSLSISKGSPDISFTEGGIMNDVTQQILAGTEINFRLTVKDQQGSQLDKNEVIEYISNFTVTMVFVEANKLTSLPLTTNNIQDSGEIRTSIQITTSGHYKFIPTYESQDVKCSICAVTIEANLIDVNKVQISMLQGDSKAVLQQNSTLLLDNNRVVPSFLMEFYDTYGNKRQVETNFSNFKGSLTVPKSSHSYTFDGNTYMGNIMFTLTSGLKDFYQQELSNSNCNLSFTAVSLLDQRRIAQSFNASLLGDKFDDHFTYDVPDPANILMIPNTITSIAGQFITFSIELRAKNGKLFYDQSNKGFYPDSIVPFTLIPKGDAEGFTLQVARGKFNGTYTVTFNTTKAYYTETEVFLSFANTSNNKEYIQATTPLKLIVNPDSSNYVVLNAPEEFARQNKADTRKSLSVLVYDRFKNQIFNADPSALGLKFLQEDASIIPTLVSDSNGVSVSFICKKAGLVTFVSLGFKANDLPVDNYTFTIIAGDADPLKSKAILSTSTINASDSAEWRIYPVDVYGNKLEVNRVGLLKQFTSTVIYPNTTSSQNLTGLQVNYPEGCLFYTVTYELAGNYRFQAYYNNLNVFSNKFILNVLALEADWTNAKLAVLIENSGLFNEYDNNDEVIVQSVFVYPELRINLYDSKINPVSVLPKDWDLGVSLTANDLDYPIIFCKQANSTADFVMCDDNALQPSVSKTPKQRWDQLVQNRTYTLTISNKGASKFGGYLNITGNDTDNGGSNLPVDIKNTIITPGTPLITTAGVSVSFWIELRTTNPNLRPNWFYEDPNSNITVSLKYDNSSIVSVKFQKGEVKGKYKATVVSTKTYSQTDPNTLTLSFDNVQFYVYQPSLIVTPGDIAKIVPYDTNNSVILSALPNATIDNVYSVFFQAFDKWNNFRPLVSSDIIRVLLVQNNEFMTEMSFQSKFTANNLYNIFFQPQTPGSYAFLLDLGGNYTFQIESGEADYANCMGSVNISANQWVTAGSIVEVSVAFYDKYGNVIAVSEDLLKTLYVKYFFKRPDVTEGFIVGNGTATITGTNSIRFLETVYVKGIYTFKVSIKNNAIPMRDSTVKVIPAAVNLTASNLRYYDTDASRYLLMKMEIAIKEDNLRTVPSYTLELTDSYGNTYDVFPTELVNKIPVVFFGHDFSESVNPLTLTSNTLLGNSLFINFTNLTTVERYKDAVFKTEPYNLRLTLETTNETVLYQIILLGEGKNDSDAQSEKDLNVSLTVLSKNSLSFKAGEYDTFMIELRDVDNKRKVDAVAKFAFEFTQADKLNDGNFKAFAIDGDLRGRFLVTVNGTKANAKVGATVLTITINGIVLQQKVLCNVVPNQLNSIKIPTNLSVIGTTDSNYLFDVIPYDLYSNIVDVQESDVNLQIHFPSNRSTYQATKDLDSGKLAYSVLCKDVGVYIIQSSLLDSPKNFTIISGQPSALYSTVYATPNQLIVGENVQISIILSDANNNKVSPKKNPELAKRFTVSVMIGTASSAYELTVDTTKDQLITSFTSTIAGVATITVLLDTNSRIPCESCSSVFKPGPLDLTKTKFMAQLGSNGFTETTSLQIAYGATRLTFMGYLYDSYNNAISGTNDSETFTMTMSGNYMTVLNVNVAKQNPNILLFALPTESADILSRIVPSNAYSLNLTYLVNKSNKGVHPLNIIVTGQDNGAGNGPWTWASIDPLPTLKLVAGVEGFFNVILYTEHNKRFNGKVNISTVQIFDKSDTQYTSSEKLNMTVYPGDANGKLSLGFLGKTAIAQDRQKNISFSVAGEEVNQKLFVYIVPNIPDLTYTELTKNLTDISISGVTQQVTLRFYDSYRNPYPTAGLTNKVFASVQIGQANFSSTISQNEYSFVVPVTPIYPPALLQLMIFYKWSDSIIYPVLSTPIMTNVRTYLDPNKTEIIGNSLPGISAVQDFSFYVLLKDKAGYCFEELRNVTVNITGPFIPGVNTTIPSVITNLPVYMNANETGLNGSALTNTSYACQKIYYGNLPAESLPKVGYYRIDVYIEGELNNEPVKTINYTYVNPGPTYPSKSILSVPQLFNRGRTPLNLEVNTPIIFKLQLADKFGNIIPEYRNDTVLTVGLSGFASQDFHMIVTNKSDGSYALNLTVQKTGSVKSLLITLNGQALVYSELQKFDVPDTIEITPGPCSSTHVFIDNAIFSTVNVTVGELNRFIIQCRDEFDNIITTGGTSFQTMMSGNDLETVGVDYADTIITDNGNGNYTYSFTVAWAGNYTVSVMLAGDPVGNPFYIFALRSNCPSKKSPLYCENIKICTSTYTSCGYDFLKNCSSRDKPYRCKVNGVSTCVEGSFECDCPDNYYKCPADKKCVPFEWADVLCSNVLMTNCPSEFPYLCSQGSCRKGPNLCPSQPGCPPNYYLCPDQTCAKNLTSCRNFTSQEYNCPMTQPWKCEDQSCVVDPTQCSTRITCNSPTSIICPDKTCATSELGCRAPAKCEGQFLCPDQSCRASRADCPQAVTCSIGQALCEDKTCKADCNQVVSRMLRSIEKLTGSSKFGRNLQESDVTVETCRADYHVCPGGECVTSQFLCPTVRSCGANKRVCPDYSCAGIKEKCVVKSCTNGQVLCWDGKCVDHSSKCSTRTTCPKEMPTKCSDGSCALNATLCPEDIQCPAYSPYRCATGECRANEKECPTLITCPANKPIQCTDGSCVVSPKLCLDVALLRKCDYGHILCPDGSCALSKLLCPAIASCSPNQIRCWDSTCVNNATECDTIEDTRDVCPNDRKLRCPDGSCRAALKDCPTQIICPITRPVKCDDGTCKQSIEQCATGTDCGYGLKRCPDGSCTTNEMNCGTPITCSKDAPYACFDSTCKKDPRDCPTQPTCTTTNPILCPDGTCTSQRVNCKRLDRCDSKTPVRCPNMNCYASADECLAISGCPAGKIMCEDGSCATYISYCPTTKCPEHLSYQCKNGMCVNNLTLCDNNNTGCPYSKPFKCLDGSCTHNASLCNSSAACPEGFFLCQDGSCSINNASCTNILGCPWESPLLCASGDCIDPSKGSCPVASCPKETPIKCLDGLCATSITMCSSFFTAADIKQCIGDPAGNMVPCADGRCVTSSDLCKPLFKCASGKVRCGDGSCRSLSTLCPLVNSTCPENKPFRCSIGACAATQDDCPNDNNGCPLKAPVKCEATGSCVKTNDDCAVVLNHTILLNNCTMAAPHRCSNGTCVTKDDLCMQTDVCESGLIRCPNSRCVSNKTDCNAACPKYTCPDSTCKNDLGECLADNGCPLHTPFLCSDGSCKQSPLAFNGELGCLPNVVCPDYKPYLCSNGECQGAPSQCQVQKPCPDNLPFQCPDYSCVATKAECMNHNLCPAATPVLCGSGRCEKTPMECQSASTNTMYCSEEKPFLCASGQCVKYSWNCTDSDSRKGNLNTARRLLQGSTSENLVVCSDGSYRTNHSSCVIIPSCPPGQYRCNSSVCADRKQDCEATDALLHACVAGTERCLDGICRTKCLNYQGCPFEKNFHCANGLCAKNEGECAGDSVCEIGYFRCIDNTCVHDTKTCSVPLRNYPSEQLQVTVSPLMTSTINFIQKGSSSSIKLGTLILPAGALLPKNIQNNTQRILSESNSMPSLGLIINPVAHSEISNYTTSIDPTRIKYVEQFFPYNTGSLSFHQAVRSPIVNLQSVNRPKEEYQFPLLLELSADLITNSNKAKDYCLATNDNYTNTWQCVTRNLTNSEDLLTNKFTYPVPEDGTYTVIFSPPEERPADVNEGCGWFCQNKWTILYVFLAIIVACLIGSYVIWRVSRYVNKYRAAKKQMANFREQINEMEKAKTDVVGQTLRDKIEGISFTTNPAFRKETSATAKEREKKLLESINEIHQKDKDLEESNKDLTEQNQALLEKIEDLRRELGKDKSYGESMDIKQIEREEFE